MRSTGIPDRHISRSHHFLAGWRFLPEYPAAGHIVRIVSAEIGEVQATSLESSRDHVRSALIKVGHPGAFLHVRPGHDVTPAARLVRRIDGNIYGGTDRAVTRWSDRRLALVGELLDHRSDERTPPAICSSLRLLWRRHKERFGPRSADGSASAWSLVYDMPGGHARGDRVSRHDFQPGYGERVD